MGRIISFDNARGERLAQPPRLHPQQGKGFLGNQYTQRSLLRQFVLGSPVRKLGRAHPEGERGVEQAIREALLGDVPGGRKAA